MRSPATAVQDASGAPPAAARSGRAPSWLGDSAFGDNAVPAALVALYLVAISLVHAIFGVRDKLLLEIYYDWFTRLAVVFSGLFILFHIRNKSYRGYFQPRSLAGLFTVFLLAPLFKSAFASFKQTIPLIHPFSWDVSLMKLDYALHLGHHPWELFEWLLAYPWAVRAIDFLYVLWFLLLAASCLWAAWSSRRRLRRRFLISTLLVWSVLGSGLGTVFSSAGPCYYSRVVPSGDSPYEPLMARLAEVHKQNSLYAVANQEGLWEAYRQERWMPFGGISAMPSIHLAMAMLFAFLAFKVRKWLGILAIGYLIIIQTGAVVLGWHYAVDGYAGMILAGVIWRAVGKAATFSRKGA